MEMHEEAITFVGFYAGASLVENRTLLDKLFYLWVSLFSLFHVSVFWSFMADLFTKEQSKRLFAFIAAGMSAGAKSYPNELFVAAGKPATFLTTPQLKELAKQMGVKSDAKTITYCNSGHLASGGWFIMHELLGNKHVKLYDGSMHEWTKEHHPVTAMKME